MQGDFQICISVPLIKYPCRTVQNVQSTEWQFFCQFNISDYKKVWRFDTTQQAFACSKSTIEKLENVVK